MQETTWKKFDECGRSLVHARVCSASHNVVRLRHGIHVAEPPALIKLFPGRFLHLSFSFCRDRTGIEASLGNDARSSNLYGNHDGVDLVPATVSRAAQTRPHLQSSRSHGAAAVPDVDGYSCGCD